MKINKNGYCPMFGDFIALKDGNLIFQFRNTKGGKRLNLCYKRYNLQSNNTHPIPQLPLPIINNNAMNKINKSNDTNSEINILKLQQVILVQNMKICHYGLCGLDYMWLDII